MTLSRYFKQDSLGDDVRPDEIYHVRLRDGTWEDVSGEELLTCAEWLDQHMSRKETTMIGNITISELFEHEASWRNVLEAKGYHDVNCSFRYEPVQDEFKIELYFYNTDWSSTYLDQALRKCSRFELRDRLATVTQWINDVKPEHEAREAALLRDYAAIKERIAASNLSDLIKAEAEALMRRMSENILPAPQPE